MTAWVAALAVVAVIALRRGPSASARLAVGTGLSRTRVHAWVVAIAVLLGAGVVAIRLSPAVVVLASAAGFVAAFAWSGVQRSRRREVVAAAVVEITFAVAGELRAGRTTPEALMAAATIDGPLAEVMLAAASAVAVGGSAADELNRAASIPGAERLRYVASAWRVAETSGGRIAVVLERLGEGMDLDDELRRELDAALAGPKATMVLLAGLPLFGLALGQLMGARPFALLLHRPLGWGLLGAAAVLDAAGVWLSRLIAQSATKC
jgi:tight adherence protein B